MNLQPDTIVLQPNGRVPNNPRPVLLYRACEPGGGAALEARFGRNGWGNTWRDGIYPFHHFHATAHEVLGIAAGQVTVRLGGEAGRDLALTQGDVVVLPAGVGHKRLHGSPDLVVVGAYPEGRDWDLVRADDLDDAGYREALDQIARVAAPRSDPVVGPDGPLLQLWGP